MFVALVFLLGVAARLVGLGDRLSHDEGYTWLVASSPSPHVFLGRLAAYKNTPPLSFVISAVLPRDSEAWLRIPALVASLACIPLAYFVARAMAAPRAAAVCALAVAVSPYEMKASPAPSL